MPALWPHPHHPPFLGYERANKSKGNLDDQLLDPYEVGNDWFEVILPSLQLILTDNVPASERQRAQFT